MKMTLLFRWLLLVCAALIATPKTKAADANPDPPAITSANVTTNGQKRLSWTPYPAAAQYQLLSKTNLAFPFSSDSAGTISGYTWTASNDVPASFHRVQVTPLSSNEVFVAAVLNRLTYGPTPEELDRIATIRPQAYIDEQLLPESLNETIDTDPPITNAPPPPPPTVWAYISVTGIVPNNPVNTNVIMYLNGAGHVYIDDIQVAYGTNTTQGTNLIINGDFESDFAPWRATGNFANSTLDSNTVHSGNASLHLIGTAAGANADNGVYQAFATNPPPVNQKMTVSFWYATVPNTTPINLIVRLSGSQTITNVPLPVLPPIPPQPSLAASIVYSKLTNAAAKLEDLRAWHVLHAVRSKTQLLEILTQFFDNHFNTQYDKSKQWFDDNFSNSVTNDNDRQKLATEFEFREISKWRQVLIDPNGTFYDMLKISAESPAMIIYLDTVLNKKGNPNENYSREVMELFSMGSDNGYTQNDINAMKYAWTGWQVTKKSPENANNPFAPRVADLTNDVGIWVLHFNTTDHSTIAKTIFSNSVVESRFPAPYAGVNYSLVLTNGTGTNGMRDGYQMMSHLANLPYTQEYISVKLCRVFVHENFDYGIYDYNAPNLAPEVQLIKDCMRAWRTPAADGRQGNIRAVLREIFNSALFRGQGASQQLVKSPLRFAAAAIRSLRATTTDNGVYTADTDGYGITSLPGGSTSPLVRMGNMTLFNRPEPDGYPETGRLWLNTANLCERMRFCEHLLMNTSAGSKSTDYGSAGVKNISDPVGLLKARVPSASWNDAGALVDFFLSILYPGEGKANLDLDRSAAIDFLNLDETNPPQASAFSLLSPTSAGYDGRVRGMVALLMTFPRYQEH